MHTRNGSCVVGVENTVQGFVTVLGTMRKSIVPRWNVRSVYRLRVSASMNSMTKEERKAIMLERKREGKMLTIERKNMRRAMARNGGRF